MAVDSSYRRVLVMDFLATKTNPEREDGEAERLIRPLPKFKPPRYDRRREQMSVDENTDEKKDPDMSKNYKDIGGAVLHRWAKKNVPVKNRETGEVVPGGVSPKTLKESPGKYEVIDLEEIKDPETKEELSSEEGGVAEETPEEAARSDQEFAAEVARKWVEERKHKRPKFQRFLDGVPTSYVDPMTGEVLVLDPETKKRVSFDQLSSDAQKALIDEFTGRREEEDQEKAGGRQEAKKRKEAAKYMRGLDPEVREAVETLGDPNSEASKKIAELVEAGYDAKDIRPEKLFPELHGKIPEDLESVGVAQQLVTSAAEYGALSEAEKAGVGEPKRRAISEGEQQQMLSYLMDNLPSEVATNLFEQDIHPDDAHELVNYYREARNRPIKNPAVFAQEVSEVYTDDLSRVKPPKRWGGKLFQHLTNEEKAEALRQQQMKVLAISAAAKENLAESLSKGTSGTFGGGVPPVLATTLAGAMLMKAGAGEKARANQSKKLASIVFDSMMSGGRHFSMSDKAIKMVMGRLDSHTREVAKAFFQANDYHAAKNKFLKSGGKLSEFESPRSILKELRKANAYLSERSALYGGGNVAQEMFHTRVMDKLRVLAPEKYKVVRRRLDKDASDEFDQAYREWEQEHKAWLKRKEAFENRAEGHPYREKKHEFNEPEPIKPIKPLGYGSHRKPSKKKGDALWEDVFGHSKTASRVMDRFVFTYPVRMTMGLKSNKSAVYHGIEPDPVKPYTPWQQAHQRDLDEPDFQVILEVARKWLATPVLSKHVEGMVPDQQFREALDYAIQTGIYNRAINPTLYNMLLARLAGWPDPGPEQTLVTIRGFSYETPTSRRPDMTAKTEEQSKYASEICGRLDKLALDIMNHHEKWGMTQEEAKVVVNALDGAADNFEMAAFGKESFDNRRREVIAAVIQYDSDEPYMDTFRNPMKPHQTDADEPYMGAYQDDQSSAVESGKERNGEPLAP